MRVRRRAPESAPRTSSTTYPIGLAVQSQAVPQQPHGLFLHRFLEYLQGRGRLLTADAILPFFLLLSGLARRQRPSKTWGRKQSSSTLVTRVAFVARGTGLLGDSVAPARDAGFFSAREDNPVPVSATVPATRWQKAGLEAEAGFFARTSARHCARKDSSSGLGAPESAMVGAENGTRIESAAVGNARHGRVLSPVGQEAERTSRHSGW